MPRTNTGASIVTDMVKSSRDDIGSAGNQNAQLKLGQTSPLSTARDEKSRPKKFPRLPTVWELCRSFVGTPERSLWGHRGNLVGSCQPQVRRGMRAGGGAVMGPARAALSHNIG